MTTTFIRLDTARLHSPPANTTGRRSPVKLSPITKVNTRITEELTKDSTWTQTGSCFDRTRQPGDAGWRPGTHFLQKNGFRPTLMAARPQPQKGIAVASRMDDEDRLNPAFTIRRGHTASPLPKGLPLRASQLPPQFHKSLRSPTKIKTNSSGNPFEQVRPHTSPGGLKASGRCGAFIKRPNPPNTKVRRFYEDGHLPFALEHRCINNKLRWLAPVAKTNYQRILPVCVDGLRELEEPYRFMAIQACRDLIESDSQDKVNDCIPHLIDPIKVCLNTRDTMVMARVFEVIRILSSRPKIADLLVPHLRQILPIMAAYINCKRDHIGENVLRTLEQLETECSTEEAYQVIKSYVPTYQSCNV